MTRKQVVHFTGAGPAWPASYVGFYSDSGATTPVTVYSDQIAGVVLASGKTGSSPVRKLRADGNGTVPPVALSIGLYVDSSVTTLYARPETVTGVAVSGAAAVSVASYGPDGPVDPVTPGGVSTSDLNAAIAALVNSAPGTLDTLGELAAALTADEGAAATLTTLVGTKAPLASPAFTGTPTAPTPSGGDSSTKIATTAFVAGAAGASALAPTAVKTSAYTAAAGDFVPVDTTSGAVTITLPTAPADKTQIGIEHVTQGSTNAVTVARGGSDVFDKAAGATSVTMPLINESLVVQYKASTGIWYRVYGRLSVTGLDARYVGIANAAVLDTTASDIQPTVATGTPLAGTSTKAAAADHQHQIGSHDHSSTNQGGALRKLRIPHAYSVSGTLAVPSAGTNFLPPTVIPVPSGKAVTVVGARIFVRAGTATLSIAKNGTALSGLSGLSITTTPTTFTATGTGSDNVLADLDQLAPVISAVSGSDGLTCVLLLDYAV